jgi:hypothetical protein
MMRLVPYKLRHQRICPLLSPTFENTKRRWPPESQKESQHQETELGSTLVLELQEVSS